jgi:hypothetical protein
MNNATDTRRFAVQETGCPDHDGGTMFWNFTAWRADHPERLMDANEAQRELDRLKASRPHAAARMSIADVVKMQARGKAAHAVAMAAANAMGYDATPKGAAKDAMRQVLRAVRQAALEAFDAGAAA